MTTEGRADLTDTTMRMPGPGDLAPGFTVEPGRCWRMVFDRHDPGKPLSSPCSLAWTVQEPCGEGLDGMGV